MSGLGPLYALLTVASTLAGGLLGIRLRHRLTGLMAFTGGVVPRRGGSRSTRAYDLGLAAYAGTFLAIGGEFPAEAHSEPSVLRLAATLGGVGLVYAVTTLLPG
jgi:hypothetical protein